MALLLPSSSSWYICVRACVHARVRVSYMYFYVLSIQVPYKYNQTQLASGWGDPSNIIKHPKDGHYYAAIWNRNQVGLQAPGICMMRTNNLMDPSSCNLSPTPSPGCPPQTEDLLLPLCASLCARLSPCHHVLLSTCFPVSLFPCFPVLSPSLSFSPLLSLSLSLSLSLFPLTVLRSPDAVRALQGKGGTAKRTQNRWERRLTRWTQEPKPTTSARSPTFLQGAASPSKGRSKGARQQASSGATTLRSLSSP